MAVLTFPNIVPEYIDFGLRFNTQISSSNLSGITQTVEMPGARWSGSVRFTDLSLGESAGLKSFLIKLRGSSGRFFYSDITKQQPFNVVTGTPTILSGTRRLINITLGVGSPTLSEGDYIQIGTDDSREYKMILSVVDNTLDNYDIELSSAIRRQTYVGQSVVYSNPTGVFLLSSDEQAAWSVRSKIGLSDLSIDFLEV